MRQRCQCCASIARFSTRQTGSALRRGMRRTYTRPYHYACTGGCDGDTADKLRCAPGVKPTISDENRGRFKTADDTASHLFLAGCGNRKPELLLAKSRIQSLFLAPQRVFEITPLVPGSPSLDARLHSPGGARRQEYRKVDTGNRKEKPIRNPLSEIRN